MKPPTFRRSLKHALFPSLIVGPLAGILFVATDMVLSSFNGGTPLSTLTINLVGFFVFASAIAGLLIASPISAVIGAFGIYWSERNDNFKQLPVWLLCGMLIGAVTGTIYCLLLFQDMHGSLLYAVIASPVGAFASVTFYKLAKVSPRPTLNAFS
jgi:hypothetical protein